MAITELDVGGAERAFVQIALGLKTKGWIVNVISLRDAGALADSLRQAGIPVEALSCGGVADLRAIGRMTRTLKANPPAVLLTFLNQANLVGRIAAKRAGVATVVSGIRVADRRWIVCIPEVMTKHLVTHYVAVSRSVADVHCQVCGIETDRIDVIYNGVDLQGIDNARAIPRRELSCSEDDQLILCVGRLSEQKAPLSAIEAFDELRRLDPIGFSRRKLIFVGDGPLRSKLEEQIRTRQLQNHVQLLGWRSDIASTMKSATVLLLASKWEGLPNVILEAQVAGLPVVASAVDGCTELVEDGQTGRLFPPGDTQKLAAVLHEVLGSSDHSRGTVQYLLARLAANARQFAAGFSWEKCVDQYDALLRKLQFVESDMSSMPDGR
jgi:glycosyltransferase involved in cell wall biosynthesis